MSLLQQRKQKEREDMRKATEVASEDFEGLYIQQFTKMKPPKETNTTSIDVTFTGTLSAETLPQRTITKINK